MIRVIKEGKYRLSETKERSRILDLDNVQYARISASSTGDILATTHNSRIAEQLLAMGKYRMYEVKDESEFADGTHLELHICCQVWQGYLLPMGQPMDTKERVQIIATNEVISDPKG